MSSVKSQESRLEGLGIVSRSLFYGAKIIKNIQTAKFSIHKLTRMNILVEFVGFVPNFQSKIPDIQRG